MRDKSYHCDRMIDDLKKPLTPVSGRSAESNAGDVLLLPIAGLAFWTLAYQFVLIVRWPAKTITGCFLTFAIIGFFLLGRLWKKSNATPGKGYGFHSSQLFLLVLGIVYATTVLFVRRPNQDDVVDFHRVLTQLLALDQPICLRQTSVDMDAAAFSPVHLAASYQMLMGFLAHYLGIDPLYFYQVVGHTFAACSCAQLPVLVRGEPQRFDMACYFGHCRGWSKQQRSLLDPGGCWVFLGSFFYS